MSHKDLISPGTRPDIIKLHPIYAALKEIPSVEVITVSSGQQLEMAEETFNIFDWRPTWRFGMANETRTSLTSMVGFLLQKYGEMIQFTSVDKPIDLMIVHGDIATSLAAAQAAFLQHVPIAHVEAGLRTARFEEPFPEEGIRRLIAQISSLHFAPTEIAYNNLIKENIAVEKIFITGNTVVDALHTILAKPLNGTPQILDPEWRAGRPLVLITCHRRESWGENLRIFTRYVKKWSERYPEVCFVWPVHANPNVHDTVNSTMQVELAIVRENLKLVPPLSYHVFTHLLAASDIVITDSGGVLEEATILGKRTLILRRVTERPEALTCDHVSLVGYDFIFLNSLIDHELTSQRGEISKPLSLFGDGEAGKRIVDHIMLYLLNK